MRQQHLSTRCQHVATLVVKPYMCGDMVSVNYKKCTKSYRISVHEIPFLCCMLI